VTYVTPPHAIVASSSGGIKGSGTTCLARPADADTVKRSKRSALASRAFEVVFLQRLDDSHA